MELNDHSHIVTCIDILGYKEVLHRDDQEEIQRIEEEFRYFVEVNAQEESSFPGFRCINYTDNFLFYYKLDYNSNKRKKHDVIRKIGGDIIKSQNERIERVLFLHIFSLALTQFDLILHNHFVRGGMTIGGFEKRNTIVSGSGLLEAHDLEERAVYPRIILNPTVVRDYITFSRPFPLIMDLEDNKIFIDFLTAQMREWFNLGYRDIEKSDINMTYLDAFKSTLMDVRKNIEIALESASNSRVIAKYKWLHEYYDFFCYSYSFLGLNELAINPLANKERFVFMKSRDVII